MSQAKLIVFTDLDGCLLDHNNYSYSVAMPLLRRLQALDIPLIINSSKTRTEINAIQKAMGISSPFIVENGAAVLFSPETDNHLFTIDNQQLESLGWQRIKKLALPRDKLLDISNRIKNEHHFKYKGFSDMSVSQIAGLTQLSEEEAYAASQRDFSEPVYWQDSQVRLQQFEQLLAKHQIQLQQGGRFIHLSGQYSKGEAMQWLLNHWIHHKTADSASIALGDSMNDASMLNLSDYAIIIKNNGNRLQVNGKRQTIRSSLSGTSGWVETLTPLLDKLLTKEQANG